MTRLVRMAAGREMSAAEVGSTGAAVQSVRKVATPSVQPSVDRTVNVFGVGGGVRVWVWSVPVWYRKAAPVDV